MISETFAPTGEAVLLLTQKINWKISGAVNLLTDFQTKHCVLFANTLQMVVIGWDCGIVSSGAKNDDKWSNKSRLTVSIPSNDVPRVTCDCQTIQTVPGVIPVCSTRNLWLPGYTNCSRSYMFRGLSVTAKPYKLFQVIYVPRLCVTAGTYKPFQGLYVPWFICNTRVVRIAPEVMLHTLCVIAGTTNLSRSYTFHAVIFDCRHIQTVSVVMYSTPYLWMTRHKHCSRSYAFRRYL